MKESMQNKGIHFADMLTSLRFLSSSVEIDTSKLKGITKQDEKPWQYFVAYPTELAQNRLISSTYLPPEQFLKALKINKAEIEKNKTDLLSTSLGSFETPTFHLKENGFELRILNGITNYHALKMSETASHGFGFEKALDRAENQNAMHELASPIAKSSSETDFGLRVFDDCIASGDSIFGYLYNLMQTVEGKTQLKKGVRVDAIVATPQSILFLKKFAELSGFRLEINVSHLGFGLNESNYITYPKELLNSGLLTKEIAEELSNYANKDDGNIYVVGDMGNAQKGISSKEMQEIREKLDNENYLRFNDLRTDPHGDHPNNNGRVIKENPELSSFDFVYFARGGYLPFKFDKEQNLDFKKANKIILRASRRELNEKYGVVFGEE